VTDPHGIQLTAMDEAIAFDASELQVSDVAGGNRSGLARRSGRTAESLRVPLVHRYLEEKTLTEIAFVLGCSDRAVAKRLARGEEVLRRRLLTRGMSAGGATLAAMFGVGSLEAAPVPPSVVESTIKAALSAAPVGQGWFASTSAFLGRLLIFPPRPGIGGPGRPPPHWSAYGLSRWLAPTQGHAPGTDAVARAATDAGSHH